MALGFSPGSPGPGGGIDFLRRARDPAPGPGAGQPAVQRTRWLALILIAALFGLAGLTRGPVSEPAGGSVLSASAMATEAAIAASQAAPDD
jgi:hypothetical protein